MGYGDFWCRHCEISHSGECKPGAAKPAAGLHDWKDLPVVDLSSRSVCIACGLCHRRALIDTFLNREIRRPVDGCPKNPV